MIRLATLSDQTSLVQCAREAYQHYTVRIGREPAPMLVDFEAEIAASEVFVWEDNTAAVVGYVVVACLPEHVFLDAVGVLPSAQGQGIGRALVAFCEALAVSTGTRKVCLYTNEKMVENIAMYKKWGYLEVGRREENGFKRVYFEKILSEQ